MRIGLAATALALTGFWAMPAAEAAYRLCVRAGSFEGRNNATVTLIIAGTPFVAANGTYTQIDTCFDDADVHGSATIGWSTDRSFPCSGAAIAQGNAAEVWFIVSAVRADPGLGGILPTCQRVQ